MQKIRVSHTGLLSQQIRAIDNFLNFNGMYKSNFELLSLADDAQGEVLLVNLEAKNCLGKLKSMLKETRYRKIISLSDTEAKRIKGDIHIILPIDEKKLQSAFDACIDEKLKKEKISVLVVDDDLSIRIHMQQKLNELVEDGIDLRFADSGEKAIEEVHCRDFDLVFMDVMMPGMDGYKACKQIKAKINTKVVMLTSKSSPINRIKSKMSGCDSFISKPPNDLELKKAILPVLWSNN